MTPELDPAAELIVACSRCTFDEKQRSDIRAILQQNIDWQRVVRLAEKNYVMPLVLETLSGDVLDLIPELAHKQLEAQCRLLKFRARLFCDELIRLNGIFGSVDISVLHYKGPVCSDVFYGNVYRRTYLDLDFLVKRDDLDEVCALLRKEGYQCNVDLTTDQQDHFEREHKEYAFTSGLICIEPHWSITAHRYPFPIDYEGLWPRAIEHDLESTKLLTFSARDMLLILSIVGAKGHWKRLQMVSDVAQFYRSTEESVAEGVLSDAQALGCERILLVAARLAETLLEAPVPDAIRNRVREDARAVDRISGRVISQLFSLEQAPSQFGEASRIFSPLLFAMRERPRDKITYLLQTTTTPKPVHLQRFPLPKWAYPAYRLIVPIHDYIVLPLIRSVRGFAGR